MRSARPSKIIRHLMKGYQHFHHKYFGHDRENIYQDLVEKGQSPKTMVIACSDSRVDPSIILNAAPGQLFMIRNVANLVPPCEKDSKHHGTSAALEFGVCFLEVEHIIIFGHSHCGGIRALMSDTNTTSDAKGSGFIASWMEIAKSAKEKAVAESKSPSECEIKCCEYSLIASLNNLLTFPWIHERVEAKTLVLHAWHFDLKTGLIREYNPSHGQFEEHALSL